MRFFTNNLEHNSSNNTSYTTRIWNHPLIKTWNTFLFQMEDLYCHRVFTTTFCANCIIFSGIDFFTLILKSLFFLYLKSTNIQNSLDSTKVSNQKNFRLKNHVKNYHLIPNSHFTHSFLSHSVSESWMDLCYFK